MRSLVILFCLLLPYQTRQPSTQTKTQYAKNSPQSTPQIFFVGQGLGRADIATPTHQKEQTDQYDPYHDTLYRWYLRMTIFGVIGGTVGILVLIWQAILTKRSANAAKEAADSAKLNAQAVLNTEPPFIVVRILA